MTFNIHKCQKLLMTVDTHYYVHMFMYAHHPVVEPMLVNIVRVAPINV